MVFKVKGIIEFSPEDKTKKHINQASWKRVAMIRTDCDLDIYYSWFLKKRFNLELNKNLRGTHVTFINDRMDFNMFEEGAKIFNGKEIDFYVEIEPRSSGKHWWLRVHCPDSENIREIMGLSKEPHYPLHLTLGNAVEKYPDAVVEITNKTAELKWKVENAQKKSDFNLVNKLLEEIEILRSMESSSLKIKKDFLNHSEYITRCCVEHELISNEPRKPLSEHEIIEF